MKSKKVEEYKNKIRNIGNKIYRLTKQMENADHSKSCEIYDEIQTLKRQVDVIEIYKQKLESDDVIMSFKLIDISKYAKLFPVISVYKNPRDYPDKYVARLWDEKRDTNKIVIKNSLDEIRNSIPDSFLRMQPDEKDDPVIIEVYI